jgi:hypothetical protein
MRFCTETTVGNPDRGFVAATLTGDARRGCLFPAPRSTRGWALRCLPKPLPNGEPGPSLGGEQGHQTSKSHGFRPRWRADPRRRIRHDAVDVGAGPEEQRDQLSGRTILGTPLLPRPSRNMNASASALKPKTGNVMCPPTFSLDPRPARCPPGDQPERRRRDAPHLRCSFLRSAFGPESVAVDPPRREAPRSPVLPPRRARTIRNTPRATRSRTLPPGSRGSFPCSP